MAARLVRGETRRPMADLPWKSLGLLELTALPSISREVWVPTVEAADALLGGAATPSTSPRGCGAPGSQSCSPP